MVPTEAVGLALADLLAVHGGRHVPFNVVVGFGVVETLLDTRVVVLGDFWKSICVDTDRVVIL